MYDIALLITRPLQLSIVILEVSTKLKPDKIPLTNIDI